MQFFDQMRQLKSDLEGLGYGVHLPEAEESEDFYASLPADAKPAMKKKFIDAHLQKIQTSDAVLIANYLKRGIQGYVGPNTLIEIAFAYALKKQIFLLQPMADQPCKDEVDGLVVVQMSGDVRNVRSFLLSGSE